MFDRLKKAGDSVRNNLLKLDSQPLGKAALTVVIFLDVFIIFSIFGGLHEHTRQLTTPNEWIPVYCRSALIAQVWNDTNRLERLAGQVNAYRERRYRVVTAQQHHTLCEQLLSRYDQIKRDRSISDQLKLLTNIGAEVKQLNTKLGLLDGAYQTKLLETIAEVDSPIATDALQQQINLSTTELNSLADEKQQIETTLEQRQKIQELFEYLAAITPDDRELLAAEYRRLNFWYPAKKLGMEMLFLAPLVLAFYLWNATSIKNARPFQILVSSHLLVVVFIPIILKFGELLYDILPRKFLKNMIQLLESLGLVAIWYYLVIALAIIAASVMIYFFQKKLFSQEKEIAKRIAKGMCQNCGVRLGENSNACSQCGYAQYHDCEHCGEPTFVLGAYCRVCGKQQHNLSAA